MQELSFEQMKDVNGGILPAIIVAYNAAVYARTAYSAFSTVRILTKTGVASMVLGGLDAAFNGKD